MCKSFMGRFYIPYSSMFLLDIIPVGFIFGGVVFLMQDLRVGVLMCIKPCSSWNSSIFLAVLLIAGCRNLGEGFGGNVSLTLLSQGDPFILCCEVFGHFVFRTF